MHWRSKSGGDEGNGGAGGGHLHPILALSPDRERDRKTLLGLHHGGDERASAWVGHFRVQVTISKPELARVHPLTILPWSPGQMWHLEAQSDHMRVALLKRYLQVKDRMEKWRQWALEGVEETGVPAGGEEGVWENPCSLGSKVRETSGMDWQCPGAAGVP